MNQNRGTLSCESVVHFHAIIQKREDIENEKPDLKVLGLRETFEIEKI